MPSSDPVRRFRDIVENVDRIEGYPDGYDLARFAQKEIAHYESRD